MEPSDTKEYYSTDPSQLQLASLFPLPYPSDPPLVGNQQLQQALPQYTAGAVVARVRPDKTREMPRPHITPPKERSKRRSKAETQGRDYKCSQCDRTYLSYPALYTHIKIKHSVQAQLLVTNGRSRGRPKKKVCYEPKFYR